MAERPVGQRYSLIYVPRGEPSSEIGERARNRLASAIGKLAHIRRDVSSTSIDAAIRSEVEARLGVRIKGLRSKERWDSFTTGASDKEILDVITIISQFTLRVPLTRNMYKTHVDISFRPFIKTAQQIFAEENLAYEIDDKGGVHPLIDPVFSNTKQLAITALSGERYAAALAHIEKVDSFLLADPPDHTAAIRAVFDANENLFKLMYDNANRLGAGKSGKKIEADLERVYRDDPTALQSGRHVSRVLDAWISAANTYRHEDRKKEPTQPPGTLGIVLISQGLAFVRWLAQLDRKLRAKQAD